MKRTTNYSLFRKVVGSYGEVGWIRSGQFTRQKSAERRCKMVPYIAACDLCGCEVGASDNLGDGSYLCDECFTFLAELNWYDPDNREERIEDYLKMKREDI